LRVPADEAGVPRPWTQASENDALLYFVQLIDELVSHQSPETSRAVSLDSYHRLLEFERIWDEGKAGGFRPDMSEPLAELLAFLGRDPVVTTNNADLWKAVEPLLRSAPDRPDAAVEAARLLGQKMHGSYLRQCRSYLEERVEAGRAKDKREFHFVTENFCSFLVNMGFNPNSIYFHLSSQFFDRVPDQQPKRELRDFFSKFPHARESAHIVSFALSEDFIQVLSTRGEVARVEGNHPIKIRKATFPGLRTQNVYALTTQALDVVDARARGESRLTQIRSVAYTVMPYADLRWHPNVVVVNHENRSVVLREQLSRIRQGRWLPRGRTVTCSPKLYQS